MFIWIFQLIIIIMSEQENELEKISKRLRSIELRLKKLEATLVNSESSNSNQLIESLQTHVPAGSADLINDDEGGLESRFGRFGLAWLGNIVLLFGIIFLTEYLMNLDQQFVSIIFGYSAAAAIYYFALYLNKSNEHLSFMFKLNALLLLFYISIKLHFFSTSPLIANKTISVALLFLVVVFMVILSLKSKSQAFAMLSVLFMLITALLSDTTHILLPLIILTAAGSLYYFFRFGWKPLLFTTIFLTYLSYSLWLFGNPFAGHSVEFISEYSFGIVYLFLLGGLFSLVMLSRQKDTFNDEFLIGVTFVNGFLFTFQLMLVVLRFYTNNYVFLFSVITVCCLIYSIVLHSRSNWNFAAAYYALYGFMAMTIALYGLYGFPQVFLLLAVQSLIVVSMALWFRNRLIVVMNSILFMVILGIYLFSSKPVDGVNFSFALMSLVSARIINWKKSRLQIKTDLIRNVYMIAGFFMVLFALQHYVPNQLVTLSWSMAALLYFVVSILLKNIKYRYMALGTMICSALYLFIVDLARIEIIYRVLALLFLAVISIGISMYYTNKIKKTDD